MNASPPVFASPSRPCHGQLHELDAWDPADLHELLVRRMRDQVAHIKATVPFYTRLYQHLDPAELRTLNDCVERIPTVSKRHVRELPSPYSLVPEAVMAQPGRLHLHRGTGGTTGTPTSMLFSRDDWRAVVAAVVRGMPELQSATRLIAFNGYNQGHISGPILDDAIRELDGLPIARNFGCDDGQAVAQMKAHGCNVLIAPPTSTHKGGSIEDLLEADARLGLNYLNGDHIDTVICSSTPLTEALVDELRGLGIERIYNFYGSTDVLPTAVSCQSNPLDLHLLQGHIALFVVDEQQRHVASGERGRVLASRIGSLDAAGRWAPQQATQLVNFEVGDEVTYIDEPCDCGRTTPRIREVQRVQDVQAKQEGGCERW